MKVKEIERTANIAWSPAAQHPVYIAAGTAAQQLDATFRYYNRISSGTLINTFHVQDISDYQPVAQYTSRYLYAQ